ncbi:MAG: hypothetical protein OEQ74_12235, partial [Gammaproteobacteria bacterium]|nr:hypothetical protein [Gammaproteobacteria bacterium]
SGISIVRVETDGKQSLWSYAGNRPLALLTNVDNLGYYTWLDVETVAMVLVDEPPRLAIATVPNGAIAEIPVQPGRSLQRVPAIGTLSFVDKSNDDTWWISDYDRHSGKIRRIAPALADSEDFAWTPEGELLMASGRLLYIWRDEWELIADLSDRVSGAITRIAVGPNGRQIAFVTLEGGL